MGRDLAIASNIIGSWSDRFRDYVEGAIITDRETMFADCIQSLFEATEYLILELEKKGG